MAVDTSGNAPASLFLRRVIVVLLTGAGAGLGGMLLALLLHAIQHIAYGYSLDHVISEESFLQGVSAASAPRRLVAFIVCGLLAGGGWWALYRWGKPLLSIKKAVTAADPRMPVISTTVHALLQIMTVALGSPLGREVAPREIGAMWSGWLAHHAGLSVGEQRIMVACGAGAGLAAVYNVPLGGALFVLEVLLCSFEWRFVVPALATSGIAAVVAQAGLGDEHQYRVAPLLVSHGVWIWAAVCGPVFGIAAFGFVKLTTAARARAARGWRLPVYAVLNFVLIGVLALVFPALPGNGKGPAFLAFNSYLSLGLAASLLILKVVIEASTLRSGAEGGLLTPGMANGAMLAILLSGVSRLLWPDLPPGALAVVGAGAFLAASMQMPLTAIALIMEFTQVDYAFLVPLLFAITGSMTMFRIMERRQRQPLITAVPPAPAQPPAAG